MLDTADRIRNRLSKPKTGPGMLTRQPQRMSGSNSIKALFLVSGAYGHMDFGGLGFLRLSQKLEAEGHSCVWISCGDQVTRLRAHGCQVEEERLLNQLSLMQMRQIEVLEKNHALREDIIAALGRVRQRMAQHRPDVVFIDRLLVGAGLAAAQLDLPYAAMGTPGGYWRFFPAPAQGRVDIHPDPEPIQEYRDLGERLKEELGWQKGGLDSGWLRSPHLNAQFLPARFYEHINDPASISIYNHATPAPAPEVRRIGVSFGNQGRKENLVRLTEALIAETPQGQGVSLFLGNDRDLYAHFQALSQGKHVDLHRWTDFNAVMPGLSSFLFLGGVGTIWHCLQNTVPMIVAPGYIGDQLENARRVAALGLGVHMAEDRSVEEITAIVQGVATDTEMRKRLSQARDPSAFSHTMDSVLEKIGGLAGG